MTSDIIEKVRKFLDDCRPFTPAELLPVIISLTEKEFADFKGAVEDTAEPSAALSDLMREAETADRAEALSALDFRELLHSVGVIDELVDVHPLDGGASEKRLLSVMLEEVFKKRAALTSAPSVPDGWQQVPIKPTDRMYSAWDKECERCAIQNYGGSPTVDDIWAIGLGAAQQPPAKEAK